MSLPQLRQGRSLEEQKDQSSPDQSLQIPKVKVQSEYKKDIKLRTDVGGKEDLEERSRQVINPLHVSTCRMPDSPNVQHPLQALTTPEISQHPTSMQKERGSTHPLRRSMHPKSNTRPRPRHVYLDLMPNLLVESVLSLRKSQFNH
jgi:hypothetical protein